MFHTCYVLIEEAKREKDKARHAYSHTIAAPNDLSAEDGANASGEDADAHAEQDDHSVANNPNAAGQLDATALQSTDASAKPSDRIVPNSPDTSGQLIPTSPHVMDEDAPTSSLSSSGSRPRTSTSGSGAASLPSRRNLGNAFSLANKSDSEYKAPETECSDNDEGGAVDGDANEGDADETESNHSVYHDDPNIVRPGEKPEDFVRLDSDDENDVNSVYDDDDDLGPTEPAVENAGTAPDLHFQPSLLGAVGGVAEISRGNVSKNVLSDIKFNGWSEPRGERMFLRDNELARGGGGGRRDDRARVLQLAREQREARGKRKEQETAARQLQAFVRGRLAARRLRAQTRAEFDQKLGDIAKLKAILQLTSMPLPYDALFELLRLVLFVYTGEAEDAERLLQLSALFGDSLAAAPDGIQGSEDKQRDWQLRRLVDLSLQCSTASSAAVEVTVGFKTVKTLVDMLPEMQQYLLSTRLIQCHPLKEMRKAQYYELPKASVTQIVRQGLISARGQVPVSSRVQESLYCNALLDFTVYLLTTTSGILEAFVMEVLSVPLLNQVVASHSLLQLTNLPLWSRLLGAGLHLSVFDFPASPATGIASEAWFLGNLLWISDRVEGKTDTVVLSEVQLLSKLLQSVPPATSVERATSNFG
ncbi:E3 ubiquitin-protein ligase UPL6 [Phytophthora cinnamomi]|uniref:E3 ubiquitin-protein ligase UPL6 n=1 Tax=Phytophthora cinnamomi TaxID=4785 RepID=UPI003559AD50|nr:E3 ubiquitin-protein ligase UPL6 [Phytophthora cinnamomi]